MGSDGNSCKMHMFYSNTLVIHIKKKYTPRACMKLTFYCYFFKEFNGLFLMYRIFINLS